MQGCPCVYAQASNPLTLHCVDEQLKDALKNISDEKADKVHGIIESPLYYKQHGSLNSRLE